MGLEVLVVAIQVVMAQILFLQQLHLMVAAMAAATFLKTQIVVVLAAVEQGMTSEELETVGRGHLDRVTQVDTPPDRRAEAVALVLSEGAEAEL